MSACRKCSFIRQSPGVFVAMQRPHVYDHCYIVPLPEPYVPDGSENLSTIGYSCVQSVVQHPPLCFTWL